MPGIAIRGCGIVTMNAQRTRFARGDILIEGDRLAYVGASLAAVPEDSLVIDGSGKVAFPGFVNTHHHLYHPLLRGLFSDCDLVGWIQACVLPTTPHLSPEDLFWGTRLTLAEAVESGVTTTIDWSYCLHSREHAAAVLEAVAASGVRVCFAYGPSLLGGDFAIDLDDLDAIRSRCFAGGREAGVVSLWAGLGGPNYQPEARLREEVEAVRAWGLPVHLHLAEHRSQASPEALRMLERCGIAGPELLLAHAIHLSDADLDTLARTGIKVSYNAPSNMRLATGVCRAVEMRRRGVDVGLGLDSAAANDTNDYFTLMRTALGLQRARWLRGSCLTTDDVLEMATVGGAKCLGLEGRIGSLEAGREADVLLIEPRTLNFMPLNDFEPQLVLCGQPRNVDTVIVAGKVLKRHGELIGIDVESTIARCAEAARRVLATAEIPRPAGLSP